MIRKALSKKYEYIILFFLKGWKSAVGILTIFCQYCFFTIRKIVIHR